MSNMQQGWAIVVHGGAGAALEYQDGCEHAARRALERLHGGGDALDAAVSAVVALEFELGLIAVSRQAAGHCSNQGMPTATITER
jgi:isoaspartyl peptidase/L-asparaginase-like protein (Ntn-hydrolase superfamily)